MRRAHTAPLSNNSTLSQLYSPQGFAFPAARPSLLCLPCSETVGVRKDDGPKTEKFWEKLFTKKEKTEEPVEYHEPSPVLPEGIESHFNEQVGNNDENLPTDDSLTSNKENLPVVQFSERFEEFMRGRLLLRDLLDPEHTTSLLRIFFNVILGLIVCILVGYAFYIITDDVMKRKHHEMEAILVDISQCEKEYLENKCGFANVPEPIRDFCVAKEKCMQQDPKKVLQTTKLTMGLIGEAVNAFIDTLTWKTIAVLLVLFFGSIFVVNRSLKSHGSARDFRGTPEYDELHSRLWRIERLSVHKDHLHIQSQGSGKKLKTN